MLDLLLAAGFFVAGVGTLAFSVVPVLGGSPQDAPEAWAAIGARVLAATLIALAPLVPAPRIIARKRVLLIGLVVLLGALVALWLPLRGFGARLSLLDSSGDGTRAVELTVATSFLALLALFAVLGFAIRYRARGEDLDSWLALGATLTLFAELHYVLTPRVSSDFVSQGDFLRLLAYGVLLVGVWRAISFAEFGRAVAEERARVAREIHDGLAQYLFAVSTHASMLESGAPLEQALPKLKQAAAAAQQEARFAVLALSSASGTAPFDAALRRYVEFLTADGVLEVDVEIDPQILLAPDEQIEVFRIVQEGLANVRKHAGAQARRGLDRPAARPADREGQRRRGRLRRRRGRGGAGPEEHAPAREDDRRRLRPPLTARARHRARGRAPRLASALSSDRDLVVQARLGERCPSGCRVCASSASSGPASSGRWRRPSCTPSAPDRSRSWGRPRRSCRRDPGASA